MLLGQAAYALAKITQCHIYESAGSPGSLGLPVSLKQITRVLEAVQALQGSDSTACVLKSSCKSTKFEKSDV